MAKKPGFSGLRDTRFTLHKRPSSELELAGKQVAIVGGTNGLGRALARLIAERGARVIVVGQTFRDQDVPRIEFMKADLSRMTDASRVGRELPAETLDLVVMTTGIIAGPKREATSEGIERDLAVSYLSRLAVLQAMGSRLGRQRSASGGAGKPRVFVMGFPGTGEAGNLDDFNTEGAYGAMKAHMNTVAGNEALVLDAVHRYPHLDVFGLNPGLIKTNIRANVLGEGSLRHRFVEGLVGLFTISPETYAERMVPLLFAPELEGHSGMMFNAKPHAILPSEALTDSRVAALMTASQALLTRAEASG